MTLSLRSLTIVPLAEMQNGQEADLFVLLSAKEELTTRDGKPYFRVAFQDGRREVSFPIWQDSPWAVDCRDKWSAGTHYKLRATYRETNYGPQLEIRKIRPVVEADQQTASIRICASRARGSIRGKCSTSCSPLPACGSPTRSCARW